MGCILTGIFADTAVVQMAGDPAIKGGWINGNVINSKFLEWIKIQNRRKLFTLKFMQILYQLLSAVVAGVWSFVLTFVILQILGLIPFLRLKLTEQEEELGSDWVELGEFAGKLSTPIINSCRIGVSHSSYFKKKIKRGPPSWA